LLLHRRQDVGIGVEGDLDTGVAARVRDRVEMVLLSAAGWSPSRIAAHLRYCPQTVRTVLRDYRDRGAATLSPRRTGPPPDAARRQQVCGLLRQLLAEERTWTAPQLAAALADHDVRLDTRQVRRYLRLLGAGYLGTFWRVDDQAAQDFAREVYTRLAAGLTLDQAVTLGRKKLLDPGNRPDWANYILYGDGHFRLIAGNA
jgi:transposase